MSRSLPAHIAVIPFVGGVVLGTVRISDSGSSDLARRRVRQARLPGCQVSRSPGFSIITVLYYYLFEFVLGHAWNGT
jgi:hypothetical protein